MLAFDSPQGIVGRVDGVEVVVAAGGKFPPWSRRSALRWSRLCWPIQPAMRHRLRDGAIRIGGAFPACDLVAAAKVSSGLGLSHGFLQMLCGGLVEGNALFLALAGVEALDGCRCHAKPLVAGLVAAALRLSLAA